VSYSSLSFDKTGPQLLSIDTVTSQIHAQDLPRIRDVIERVGVEDDEIGALAHGNHAEIIEPENLR
jgi:hypothetical protein